MGFEERLRPQRELLSAVKVGERLTGAGRFFVPLAQRSAPVLRADDLVVLSITWTGLDLTVVDGVAVLKDSDGRGGTLVAHFQPQHVDEEAIWEVEQPETDLGPLEPEDKNAATKVKVPPEPDADYVAESRLAAASRLAFDVPVGWGPIEYTVAGILDAIGRLALRVHPGALPRRGGRPIDRGPVLGGLLGELGQVLRQPGVVIERQPGFGRIDIDPTPHPDPDPGPLALAQTVGRRLLDAQRLVADVPASQRLLTRQRVQSFAVHSGLTGAAGAIERPIKQIVELNPNLVTLVQLALRAPTDSETAIELPTKLILSPTAAAGFAHETTARALGTPGRSELWHTRLGARVAKPGAPHDVTVDEHPAAGRTARAVWSRSGLPADFKLFPHTGEPDLDAPPPESDPPLHTLDARDRWSLVHLTADYGQKGFEPDPIDVDGLMLTALGGWLDSRGAWPNGPDGISLSEWRHRATLGRDHFVRVVYEGVLLPWGHRAALVKVSERKFHNGLEGNPAFLRQRMFIVVRQPHLAYTAPGLKNASGDLWEHALPFGAITIRTAVTPPLQPPGQGIDGQSRNLFIPHVVPSAPFLFAMRAETLDGGRVDFCAPAAFAAFEKASGDTATIPQTASKVNLAVTALGADLEVDLHGQRVPLAPSGAAGDTILPVHGLRFGAQVPDDDATYTAYTKVADRLPGDKKPVPRCYPRVVRVQVELPVAKHFAGGDGRTWMRPAQSFLRTQAGGGFGAGNDGQVFLISEGTPVGMDFSSRGSTTGGLIQPSFAIQGVSRLMGPVSGTGQLETLAGGGFEPEDFFGDGFDPLLFGVIPLTTIVQAAGIGEPGAVPKFLTELATALEGFVAAMDRAEAIGGAVAAAIGTVRGKLGDLIGAAAEEARAQAETALRAAIDDLRTKLVAAAAATPEVVALRALIADAQKIDALLTALRLRDEMTLRFQWSPKLQDALVFIAHDDHATATLVVAVEGKVKTSGATPTFDVAAKLEHFTLDLIHGLESFLEIQFDRLHFLAPAGRKPDIVCDIGKVEFVGVLSFVEALKSLIPLDGFSDPPALDVSAEGVKADYSLALPDIAFGVFALQNLSLSAGFTVPFVAKPLSVRFSFCERHSPFLLTVSAFGGGGFVSICVDPDGVQSLEAGFEFGASLAMNFGVASGEVHVLGGFVYAMVADAASLTGYLRIGGSVEALGIITVSIELALELHYEFASGKCVGKATLTIEVDIAFFSVSVEISCERRFAGSNGDPPMAWLMGPTADLPAPAPAEPAGTFPWIEYRRAFA